jgi:NADH:ubiquinone oxidoreductase subunit 3 (subunit A)
MSFLWNDYLSIFLYFGFSLGLSAIILLISYLFAIQRPDLEKLSAYECGFSPFDDARKRFDVRFYLVSILFIIFDLEVSLLFPWVTVLSNISSFGFWSMFIFLLLLTVGFLFEWRKGAIEWQ